MAEHTLDLTDTNFQSEVLSSPKPVLVDFWASWCGPCLAIAPHVETIAKDYAGQLKVGKLNVDDNPHTAAQYGIRSIPTLIVFKDGKPVEQIMGAVPKSTIESMVANHLA